MRENEILEVKVRGEPNRIKSSLQVWLSLKLQIGTGKHHRD